MVSGRSFPASTVYWLPATDYFFIHFSSLGQKGHIYHPPLFSEIIENCEMPKSLPIQDMCNSALPDFLDFGPKCHNSGPGQIGLPTTAAARIVHPSSFQALPIHPCSRARWPSLALLAALQIHFSLLLD
jgi:hypothetical protein